MADYLRLPSARSWPTMRTSPAETVTISPRRTTLTQGCPLAKKQISSAVPPAGGETGAGAAVAPTLVDGCVTGEGWLSPRRHATFSVMVVKAAAISSAAFGGAAGVPFLLAAHAAADLPPRFIVPLFMVAFLFFARASRQPPRAMRG